MEFREAYVVTTRGVSSQHGGVPTRGGHAWGPRSSCKKTAPIPSGRTERWVGGGPDIVGRAEAQRRVGKAAKPGPPNTLARPPDYGRLVTAEADQLTLVAGRAAEGMAYVATGVHAPRFRRSCPSENTSAPWRKVNPGLQGRVGWEACTHNTVVNGKPTTTCCGTARSRVALAVTRFGCDSAEVCAAGRGDPSGAPPPSDPLYRSERSLRRATEETSRVGR